MPSSPTLTELFGPLRGDRTYDQMIATAVDELIRKGEVPADFPAPGRPWLYAVSTGNGWKPGWVSADNMRVLAQIYRVSHAQVYSANAVTLGLQPPNNGTFASAMPAWVDELPPGDHYLVRSLIQRMGEANGLA